MLVLPGPPAADSVSPQGLLRVGCMLVLPGQPATHVQVPPHLRAESVADTTGAGDGFLGEQACTQHATPRPR